MKCSFIGFLGLSALQVGGLAAAEIRVEDASGAAVQRAIDKVSSAGGGKVVLPPGEYLTGGIVLRDNVELHLEKDAVIRASSNAADYVVCAQPKYSTTKHALIQAIQVKNASVTGEGSIDGVGARHFDMSKADFHGRFFYRKKKADVPACECLYAFGCRNLKLTGVSFVNSSSWTVYLRCCEDVSLDSVKILNDVRWINCDGLDLDACRNVTVRNSRILSGDDGLVLRAIPRGSPDDLVLENVRVENCDIESGCQCVRLGLSSDRIVRNCTLKNLKIKGYNGIIGAYPNFYCSKSNEGSCLVENVVFDGVTGEAANSILEFSVGSGVKIRGINDVTFRNFNVKTVKPLRFVGNVWSKFRNIRHENFTVNGKRLPDGEFVGDFSNDKPFVRFKGKLNETREGHELKLMGVDLGHSAEGLAAAIAAINEAKPDFVAVRGADWMKPRSGRVNQGTSLAKATGMHATWQILGSTDASVGHSGVVVLSREKPCGRRIVEIGDQLQQGIFICEFRNCCVIASELDKQTVAVELGKLKLKKTCYVPEDGLKVLSIAAPRSAGVPALVPKPVKCEFSGGFLTLGISEGSDEYENKIAYAKDATIAPEGYRLTVSDKGIKVAASDEAGRFYARRTLAQLVTSSYGRMIIPHCRIEDRPRFKWRGMHLDEARHFFGKAAVKRFLKLIADHKFNVFHWHLTDNQGWVLASKRHPEVAEKGSVRPYKSSNGFLDRFEDGDCAPNFYTEDEVREILDCAAKLNIAVMPEIDVPGHCKALLKLHPEFRCYDKDAPGAPAGSNDNVLCIGNDDALAFVDDIFDEVAGLFPGEYVHIGGDEVNRVNWANCEKCRRRMEQEGLESVEKLQLWFMNRLAKRLRLKGKKVCGWGSAIKTCGLFDEEVGFLGCHTPLFNECAAKGHSVVSCSDRYAYYIYDQGLANDPATYPWFSFPLTLEKAYAYDPCRLVEKKNQARVLGGQGYNWTECAPSEVELNWTMWPRACATAEALWSPVENKDFEDFGRRMKTHWERLRRNGVYCAPMR